MFKTFYYALTSGLDSFVGYVMGFLAYSLWTFAYFYTFLADYCGFFWISLCSFFTSYLTITCLTYFFTSTFSSCFITFGVYIFLALTSLLYFDGGSLTGFFAGLLNSLLSWCLFIGDFVRMSSFPDKNSAILIVTASELGKYPSALLEKISTSLQ